MPMTITDLTRAILEFRDQRDWQQFHSPKNLAISLSLEAAEILEHFQWTPPGAEIPPQKALELEKEIGDVLIYLLLLAAELKLDPIEAAVKKLEENRVKYPVEKAKGNATKYTEL
jgi:NTP pyrophosphatase (non-canonical NTP hydrolase)